MDTSEEPKKKHNLSLDMGRLRFCAKESAHSTNVKVDHFEAPPTAQGENSNEQTDEDSPKTMRRSPRSHVALPDLSKIVEVESNSIETDDDVLARKQDSDQETMLKVKNSEKKPKKVSLSEDNRGDPRVKRTAGLCNKSHKEDFFLMDFNGDKKPVRGLLEVWQLMSGEVIPTKCQGKCAFCWPLSPQGSPSKGSESSSSKREPVDISKISSFPHNDCGDPEERPERKRSAAYRNAATSECSPKKRRPADADTNDGYSSKKAQSINACMYRTAAGLGASTNRRLGSGKAVHNKGTDELKEVKQPTFRYWRVMYAKPSSRKHKIWEDDGVLIVNEATFVVKGSEQEEVARSENVTLIDIQRLKCGYRLLVGSKEVEILEGISDKEFVSGAYRQ